MFGKTKNLICLFLFLCLAGSLGTVVFGQEKKPPKTPKVKVYPSAPGAEPPGFFNGDGVTSERSMAVDPNVAIQLCVAEGDLKVNGWRRSEVRVFVKHGRKFHIKEREKSAESGKAVWLSIGSVVNGPPGPAADCLAGESIEIDAPHGASLDLSGREVRTSVDSLKKVKIDIVAGAITIRNITGGVSANSGRGDLMVENSAGSVTLGGTTGNIIVIEVSPGQIGDLLKAKTNSGAISMQRVAHRQIQANSISGSILFDGKFLSGGIYNFRTSNGSIKLAIPAISSCTFRATYGLGNFSSELPLKIIQEDESPRAKTVIATLGKGDANVSLTTNNGSIGIRKTVDVKP